MRKKHSFFFVGVVLVTIAGLVGTVHARSNIRSAFFAEYPNAVGTTIETVPSQPNHCGVCHYDFAGTGLRNPYGVRLGEVLGDFGNNENGKRQAIRSIENEDPDLDGYSTLDEVTDTTTYDNTPTFPGLKPANIGSVVNVDVADIQTHLIPSTGSDSTPPVVAVIAPNGPLTLTANTATTIQWTATDIGGSGVASINLYLSLDNGATFKLVAKSLSNSGSYTWFPANRPSTESILRVEATDNAFNTGFGDSHTTFTIESPPGGLVPTTLRDFDQPGSQPFESGVLNPPQACAVCHADYGDPNEPYSNWEGSLMSQASIDPIFLANMEIANQDAPDSGDLCLRCHFPRGWLQGRSIPTDGSAMLPADEAGVSCDFCHRLLDPIYEPGVSPIEDDSILAALSFPAVEFGNGMYTIDPTGARRGPFVDATSGHAILVSPFHREAALCGTCHDVSNPAFEKDGDGGYAPNALDTTATDFSPNTLLPVERTYSEWLHSTYNTQEGVYAPEFGGNKAFVSTCQDCHMRDVTGHGAHPDYTPPLRTDLPLHDMTGGSTWLPTVLIQTHPGQVNPTALNAGIDRARYMLLNAADLSALQVGEDLKVTVTNRTGHKLPTGYPEGRRMWLNVIFYDQSMNPISESGAYDVNTGVLSHDEHAKIYEIEPAIDETVSGITGIPVGPSFHFVLNSTVASDNRIPPRGFTNAAFDNFGGSPVDYSYDDGQYWDDTEYSIPLGATSAQVTLYYQSTSKEFVEFLRDENNAPDGGAGQVMFDLWNNNGKCPPEPMQQIEISLTPTTVPADLDHDFDVDLADFAIFAEYWPWSYPD